MGRLQPLVRAGDRSRVSDRDEGRLLALTASERGACVHHHVMPAGAAGIAGEHVPLHACFQDKEGAHHPRLADVLPLAKACTRGAPL